MKLAAAVSAHLASNGVRHAFIGAFALGLHGFARFSLDVDLLVLDRSVLQEDFWHGFETDAERLLRRGDDEDPLAGVVRFRQMEPREQVDLIVGKRAWNGKALDRALPARPPDVPAPYLRLADLVLLKLEAAGGRDKVDIQTVLLSDRRDEVLAAVEADLSLLVSAARALWRELVAK